MKSVEKNSSAYDIMKIRYIELKLILQAANVSLDEIDLLKE